MCTAEDVVFAATYLELRTDDSTENYYSTYKSYKPETL
jgi:hypothetical protein